MNNLTKTRLLWSLVYTPDGFIVFACLTELEIKDRGLHLQSILMDS